MPSNLQTRRHLRVAIPRGKCKFQRRTFDAKRDSALYRPCNLLRMRSVRCRCKPLLTHAALFAMLAGHLRQIERAPAARSIPNSSRASVLAFARFLWKSAACQSCVRFSSPVCVAKSVSDSVHQCSSCRSVWRPFLVSGVCNCALVGLNLV